MICRLEFVAKLRELTEHTRVIAVRHDAPNEEWIALARAAHELDPFTRVATFGETDQDRCALIGEVLGITTHSQQTVELVHDKHAMRVRLRETGVDTTASAVVADLAALSAFVGEHPGGLTAAAVSQETFLSGRIFSTWPQVYRPNRGAAQAV